MNSLDQSLTASELGDFPQARSREPAVAALAQAATAIVPTTSGTRRICVCPTSSMARRSQRASPASETTKSRTGNRNLSPISGTEPFRCGRQRTDLPGSTARGHPDTRGKKTTAAIQKEAAQELSRFLRVIFTGWHKNGCIELEAGRCWRGNRCTTSDQPSCSSF